MKKIKYVIGAIVLFATTAYGQSTSQDPTPLNDPKTGSRLEKDFDSRNSNLSNATVNWYGTDYGYYGTYSNDGTDYMTRYDKNGNYVETLNKKDWSTDVSPEIKSSFDKSSYKDQSVTSYWESSDTDKKGYYIEVREKGGKTQRIWSDDKGQFSKKPYETNSKSKTK